MMQAEENRINSQKIHLRYIGSRTKIVEKRILSLLRRRKSFLLTTLSVKDNKTKEEWHVDSWGWVSVMNPESGRYEDNQGHIKNSLEFLGGPKPIWYDPDRLEKRTYTRRNVHRGKV